MQDQPKDVRSVSPLRHVVRDAGFGREDFITATVTLTDGSTIGVSQYADEAPKWGVDSAFLANGYPLWCNGEGARYLIVKALAEDIAEYLNELRDAEVMVS